MPWQPALERLRPKFDALADADLSYLEIRSWGDSGTPGRLHHDDEGRPVVPPELRDLVDGPVVFYSWADSLGSRERSWGPSPFDPSAEQWGETVERIIFGAAGEDGLARFLRLAGQAGACVRAFTNFSTRHYDESQGSHVNLWLDYLAWMARHSIQCTPLHANTYRIEAVGQATVLVETLPVASGTAIDAILAHIPEAERPAPEAPTVAEPAPSTHPEPGYEERAVAAAYAIQKSGGRVSVNAVCKQAGLNRSHLINRYPDAVKLVNQIGSADRNPRRGSKGQDGSIEAIDE